MAGFMLPGYLGRVPCAYCKGSDCAGRSDGVLICIKTARKMTIKRLERSAKKAQLPRYRRIDLLGPWFGKEVVSAPPGGIYVVGHVHLFHEHTGARGISPNSAMALEFATVNLEMPMAFATLSETPDIETRRTPANAAS